jgi:hypothetical protein
MELNDSCVVDIVVDDDDVVLGFVGGVLIFKKK